jgi:hypothetical protein
MNTCLIYQINSIALIPKRDLVKTVEFLSIEFGFLSGDSVLFVF